MSAVASLSRRTTVRSIVTIAVVLVMSALAWSAAPTAVAGEQASSNRLGSVSAIDHDPAAAAAQQVANLGSANAASQQVEQSIALVDRATGELVAGYAADEVFNTESILKLFTAAYYLVEFDGAPDADLEGELRTMIAISDNGIQSALWQWDIVPTIAERYGLTDTRNGPNSSSQSWGSDRTTANDQALFLYRMSQDPMVGPKLMAWMTATEPTGADGFNQEFGFNALTGDHGSKQGWSDPGWSPANLHSVGWTAGYFAAILQNSPSATYATMRATSTATAQLIASIGEPRPSNRAASPSPLATPGTATGSPQADTAAKPPVVGDLGQLIARAVKMKNMLVTLGVTERSIDAEKAC
jgi:hypothetical protein